jgi:hypothetical protein
METILFKTRRQAEAYAKDNYPGRTLRDTSIGEDTDYTTDMVNLQWSGETPAWMVEDDDCNTLAVLAWWDEGDDLYELYVGDRLAGTYDDGYDAREAYRKALEAEEDKDEDVETFFEVKLFCNGEDISD